ncbi:hypothetical protein Desti_3725 [Desulfomonile tiedjei DSM 6799]|uniref:DUF503 domain-containing protein n=2 Tax=Desulfomonile tiedjei TaxID=2358 RepID=I4C9X8_DESTA|nr:hypothetical protein Desti_3725 [Desulfomonile tiedjei DSM 6799]
MVVGIGVIELMVHNSSSLKAKRQVVKSILGKVRSKFDVSIAEVADQDKWQRCTIGFSVVTNDSGYAHTMLETIINYVESLYLAEIVDSRIEIVHY